MQERRLGHSGLRVSRLALGTMSYGSVVDEVEAEDQLRTFLDAGGTLVDTAPIYGDGRAEYLLGDVIGKLGVRDQVLLAGKAGLSRRGDRVVRDNSRGALLDQLDRSLRDLGTDHLDLWQIHRWDESTPPEETLSTLEFAVSSGRVRYLGLSNFTAWQFAIAHGWLRGRPSPNTVLSNQVEYSLLNRACEHDMVPAAEHLQASIMAWSPLGRGVLTGKYRGGIPNDSRGADSRWEHFVSPYLGADRANVVEALARAAEGLGVSMTHVALAWLRDKPHVGSVVLGARTVKQLRESLASEDVDIPDPIIAALDDVSARPIDLEV